MTGPALVTGGTGYLGANLVRHLLANHRTVTVVTRQGSDLSSLEVAHPRLSVHTTDGSTEDLSRAVQRARPDVAFHLGALYLAAHQPRDVSQLVSANINFTASLLDALAQNGVRDCIHAGTASGFDRDGAYRPVSLYAATKYAADQVATYYAAARGMNIVTLALFDTYGPADPRGKLVSQLWESARSGTALALSPGQQLIDLVFVTDVVEAFLAAAASVRNLTGQQRLYGVTSGAPVSLERVVRLFTEATGLAVNAQFGALPYRDGEIMVPWVPDSRLPGWSPRVSLADGLRLARPSPA